MFLPNSECLLRKRASRDKYGQEQLGDAVTIQYAPVDLERVKQKTSVRSDSSASRGQADQVVSQAKILVPANTVLAMDDQVEIEGYFYRVAAAHPRKSVFGRLDHHEITLEAWPA